MQLRGFVALGLCAVVFAASPSLAGGMTFDASFRTESVASAKAPDKPVKKNAKARKGKTKELTPTEKKAAEKAEKKKLAEQKKAEAAKKLAEKKKAQEAARLVKAKALEEKKAAAAKAAEERKAAAAKAAEEKRIAKAKALEEKRLAAKAKAEAAQAEKLARAKAKEEQRLARLRAAEEAEQARIRAAEEARQAEIARLASMEIAKTGNNGELRSEAQAAPQDTGFLGLFGAKPQKASMLTETRALDAALEQREGRKKFKVRPEFEPRTVDFPGYQAGTIVIDTEARYLYLVQSLGKARRYAIAVGRDGLQYKGTVTVGDKQEWPRWIPTLDMQKREPQKYGQYKDGMPGGPDNPLGARAIYLYEGRKDTHLRIHGTNQPQSIGTSASNGCFRMINEHVQDLYSRVKVGTQVIVM